MNFASYDIEVERQLSDNVFYKKMSTDPTNVFKNEIQEILQEFVNAGEITKQEFDFMKVDYPVTPVIYVLPKIHKDLTNLPGRPIISGIGSLTEKISTFVDFS